MLSRLLLTSAIARSRVPELLPASALRAPAPRALDVGGDVESFVQRLSAGGATKAEISDAFASALAGLVDPPPPPPPPPILASQGTPVAPKTITDAKRAFRSALGGAPLVVPTLKFTECMIETSCIYRFEYERIFALGFTALCDAFLQSCINEQVQEETRAALCFGLGLDAVRVREDAAALRELALGLDGEEAIFATEDIARVASARNFRYTYAFGVGLVILMKLAGTDPEESAAIRRWCDRLELTNVANTLEGHYTRPLSVVSIGRFSFDSDTPIPEALESIGTQGNF